MADGDETNSKVEEIRQELGIALTDQTSRLTEVTRRKDASIANPAEQITDLSEVIRDLQATIGGQRGQGGQGEVDAALRATRAIKLDLPKFSGIDPKGWIYQAEEYFTFHGIFDDFRIQIVGFHMTRGALGWIRGL